VKVFAVSKVLSSLVSKPKDALSIAGLYKIYINGQLVETIPNLVVDEGKNYILHTALGAGTPITNWYIALFSGNVVPQASWTAATFVSAATEFTNYSETSRRPWMPGSVFSGSIDNFASKATFTVSADNQTIRGVALISSSAKSNTTGVLLGAALFTSPKTLDTGETIDIGYSISLS
jgi:hypothetical protein